MPPTIRDTLEAAGGALGWIVALTVGLLVVIVLGHILRYALLWATGALVRMDVID